MRNTGLVFSAFLFACSGSTADVAQANEPLQIAYAGHLSHVFCDVKRPLHGDDTALHDSDYGKVLDGFVKLGCNGVRVYIDPSKPNAVYHPHYTSFVAEARKRGFRIYANPLGTGDFGKTDAEYIDWIVDYANEFMPHYLGPFNEPAMDVSRMTHIASEVRRRLTYFGPRIVGPDSMHLDRSLTEMKDGLVDALDVAGSHNAAWDDSATRPTWDAFANKAGSRPAWSTENPEDWVNLQHAELGIRAVVHANIDGLVIYEAFPRRVRAEGTLTKAAEKIAEGIRR